MQVLNWPPEGFQLDKHFLKLRVKKMFRTVILLIILQFSYIFNVGLHSEKERVNILQFFSVTFYGRQYSK